MMSVFVRSHLLNSSPSVYYQDLIPFSARIRDYRMESRISSYISWAATAAFTKLTFMEIL
jgi:hypothetical protein